MLGIRSDTIVKTWNADNEYNNPEAPCSYGMLTFIWKLTGHNIKTQGKDANGRQIRWDISYKDAGNLIEYLKAVRLAHSTNGDIWHITADGKRILKEYSAELIAQFPQLALTPRDNGVKTIAAPIAITIPDKPSIGGMPAPISKTAAKTAARVKRAQRMPTGSIPIGKPQFSMIQ